MEGLERAPGGGQVKRHILEATEPEITHVLDKISVRVVFRENDKVCVPSHFPVGIAGTSWSIDLFSSAIPGFSFSGSNDVIAAGNDGIFGDRYLVILDLGSTLPLGLGLASFLFDLQDLFVPPADMLSDASFASLPNLALAQSAGGMFSINGNAGGCQHCLIEITSLTEASLAPYAMPVPAATWLFGSALLGLLGFGRHRKVS